MITRRLPESRLIRIALLILLAVITALPLLYSHLNSSEIVITKTVGEASIYIAGDRDRVLFPGECVAVTWRVEGIKAIYLNGLGQIGSGEKEVCTFGNVPTLKVKFQDDAIRYYRLGVEQLYRDPIIGALVVVVVVALVAAAYLAFGAPGSLVILTLAFFGPLLRVQASQSSNFIDHTKFARRALESHSLSPLPPQFLFHGLIVILNRIFPGLNLINAGFIVAIAAYLALALGIYFLLRWLTGVTSGFRYAIVGVILTLSLMLIGPVSFLSGQFNPAYRFALIHPNLYHSPTSNLLRPLAILIFFAVAKALTGQTRFTIRLALTLGLLTLLATFAKPNYTLALVPGIVLVVFYNFFRPFIAKRKLLLVSVMLPATLALGWQYLFLYGPQPQSVIHGGSATIAFAPFELFTVWWKVSWGWIILELFLSILFPLAVYLAYFRSACRNIVLNFAWLLFLIGMTQAYLFIEVGDQASGNFVQSGQITLLVLFVVSMGFFVRQNASALFGDMKIRFDWRFYTVGAIFALHLVNRLVYLL